MLYSPAEDRYASMHYNRCGKSGLFLPPVSLGLWHNFGALNDIETARRMVQTAFDHGVTHFDLANNYGPPPGSAEKTFGRILKQSFARHRDEMIISTKAGHLMWDGPYGDWGSRKHVLSSLDQSLRRLRIDYVDIFYIHRYDPDTPLEETVGALITAVKQGKALYAGLSKFPAEAVKQACAMFREAHVPCIVHQVRYSMFDREAEKTVFPAVTREKLGCVVFSPLAQGMLTDRYLDGIPIDSRAAGSSIFLNPEKVQENYPKIINLAKIAADRGQRLSQMAIAWVLRNPHVTSAIIGASKPEQILDCLKAIDQTAFSPEELAKIDRIIG